VRNRHFQIFKNGSKKGKNLKKNEKKKWGRRRRNEGREKKMMQNS